MRGLIARHAPETLAAPPPAAGPFAFADPARIEAILRRRRLRAADDRAVRFRLASSAPATIRWRTRSPISGGSARWRGCAAAMDDTRRKQPSSPISPRSSQAIAGMTASSSAPPPGSSAAGRARPVRLIGLPTDAHSSFLRGAAAGPGRDPRRAGLRSCQYGGRERAGDRHRHRGRGWWRPRFIRRRGRSRRHPRARSSTPHAAGAVPISLGGDHSVTYPIVAALAEVHGPLNILHFDAHPDLYDDYEGDPLSHASPFARIMESGHARRLVQFGIRTLNAHCRAQADALRRRDRRDARFRAGPRADPGGAALHQHRSGRLRSRLRAGCGASRAGRAERPRVPAGAAARARAGSSAPTSSSCIRRATSTASPPPSPPSSSRSWPPSSRERVMIKVHHLENSRSQRILWLLEELGASL